MGSIIGTQKLGCKRSIRRRFVLLISGFDLRVGLALWDCGITGFFGRWWSSFLMNFMRICFYWLSFVFNSFFFMLVASLISLFERRL